MKRYIESVSRDQGTLFPDHLEDWINDENVVRVIDAFVDELDLVSLGFELAEATGRPGHHPSILLKLYIYGYLNRIQSSRRLERETRRNKAVNNRDRNVTRARCSGVSPSNADVAPAWLAIMFRPQWTPSTI